jgi:predicted nuclease of restriction endonuclease-like (RecB) superfamily
MEDQSLAIPSEYGPFLEDLKSRIRSAQVRAAVAVNSELVTLYWNIGKRILAAQQSRGWGAGIIPTLSKDLTSAFPGMKGFSTRNLDYMLAFARAWPDEQISQQAVAKLPWGHNIVLLQKLDEPAIRLWYAQKAVEHGWSRNVMVLQIESRLHAREGKAITNFDRTLPAPLSDLAQQITKDPYNFEFLTLQEDAEEREIEDALIAHIRKFLLELGAGFAFVGSQYHLDVGGEDFYIDILFYHLKLRCYVVIELKTGKFKPEYAGKLNFYLAVVDDLLRHESDAPTIGLILCKDKKEVVAEYALRGMSAPIGVSEFGFTEALPEELASSLPTVEQIEKELIELPDEES